MHPSALLVIVVAAGAAVLHGVVHPAVPAVLFWEKTLPSTPIPDAIADLVQRGIDHSPLEEHYSALPSANNVCIIYDVICDLRSRSAGTGLFFHESQLRPGSTMIASFPAEPESAILPHDVRQGPFRKPRERPQLLASFGISAGSAEAAQVRDTLHKCQAPPLSGEPKACATSLEGTVRSAVDMLGGVHVWAAASSALPRSGLPRRRYEVETVAPLDADGNQYVACHKMPYVPVRRLPLPQCHITGMSTKAYKVSLRGRRGEPPAGAMVAVCHRDTSRWNPAHQVFELLHTHPGGAPVCHFMPYANLVFGKKKAAVASDKLSLRTAGMASPCTEVQ